MTYIIFFTISLLASIIGSICGIGGGVFIKPSLDASGVLPVNTITFLSTCTVMSMAFYNVVSNITSKKDNLIDWNLTTYLAIGSAIGGLIGKTVYSNIKNAFSNSEVVGGYQAIALFIAISFVLTYAINKHKVKGMKLKNPFILIVLGFILGTISSFVGIGGGPINLAVLYFFFSMPTKIAAQNSIYMILISQISSLFMTFICGNVPKGIIALDIELWVMMIGMIICGIFGGKIGKSINRRLSSQNVDKLFTLSCLLIMGLCLFNALTKLNII